MLCTFIQTTETSALICLGDQSGSSAVTVLSQDNSMYIFDSHSRDQSGMPSANGTAVLMQFNNIQSTVSFICQLAYSLRARLFHWTFWHSIPATTCDCDTSLGKIIPSIDILSEKEIRKMYSELVPKVPQQDKRRNYYQSYKQRTRQSETPDESQKRRECDRLRKASVKQTETPEQTSQRKQSKRQYSASVRQTETAEDTAYRRQYNRQYKKTSRAQETPQETKQ